MIRPDVATTIVTATTDAIVEPGVLAELLRSAADASLNLVSVDGSESTNDTLVVLASGASGVTASGADAAALGLRAHRRAARRRAPDGRRRRGRVALRALHRDRRGRRRRGAHRRARDRRGHPRALRAARLRPQLGPHARARGHLRRRARPRAHRRLGRPGRSSSPTASRSTARAPRRAPRSTATEVEIRIDLAAGDGRAELYASSLSPEYVTFNAEYTT